MAGPVREQIEHYGRLLEQLRELSPDLGENLCWTVVQPHGSAPTVRELVHRLRGDTETLDAYPPAEAEYDDDLIFLEQRGDAVVIVGFGTATAEVEALQSLSRGATLHSVFWMINNFSRLYRLVDGVVVTEVETLNPVNRRGRDPEALTDHLDALLDLRSGAVPEGTEPDWETAMATMESLTGRRLDADWFTRPQTSAQLNVL